MDLPKRSYRHMNLRTLSEVVVIKMIVWVVNDLKYCFLLTLYETR
jgi:hypothetical protein